jgi:3,4-dihydroxy 2-butanone 4-phosphate synthase/GTP cyclohydrolase II
VEHMALIKGDIAGEAPLLVRMHAVDTFGDLLTPEQPASLHGALAMITAAGRGVAVLIREYRQTALSERLRAINAGLRVEPALRDYGIGAQILTDLGVKDMILLSNHKRTIIGLDGYGLNVVEQRGISEANA